MVGTCAIYYEIIFFLVTFMHITITYILLISIIANNIYESKNCAIRWDRSVSSSSNDFDSISLLPRTTLKKIKQAKLIIINNSNDNNNNIIMILFLLIINFNHISYCCYLLCLINVSTTSRDHTATSQEHPATCVDSACLH